MRTEGPREQKQIKQWACQVNYRGSLGAGCILSVASARVLSTLSKLGRSESFSVD